MRDDKHPVELSHPPRWWWWGEGKRYPFHKEELHVGPISVPIKANSEHIAAIAPSVRYLTLLVDIIAHWV